MGFQALGSRITRAPFPLFHDGCWGATLESQAWLRCVSACLPSSAYGARKLRIVDKKVRFELPCLGLKGLTGSARSRRISVAIAQEDSPKYSLRYTKAIKTAPLRITGCGLGMEDWITAVARTIYKPPKHSNVDP